MINPITPGRRDAISLRGIDAAKGGGSAQASAAMGKVGGRIADTLSREFELIEREAGGDYLGGSASDYYGVEETATELADALGGGPADRGRIARSLHEFAQEAAALIAARPGSKSVTRLQSAMGDSGSARGTSEADRAVDTIDATTQRLREGSAR